MQIVEKFANSVALEPTLDLPREPMPKCRVLLAERPTIECEQAPVQEEDTPSVPELGSILDSKYELMQTIGAGGMGVVYLAFDRRLDRDVAIKVVHPYIASDPELRSRLAEEARHMAKLRHPNIMEIYDIGYAGESPYLVMPYYRGLNLAEWAGKHHGLPVTPAVAVGIINQACDGIAALHEIGVTHYDIKPANILLESMVGAVIADLGLAQHIGMHETNQMLSGTLGFMAPERMERTTVRAELAHKADVYALGVTAYWMLVGHMPTGEGDTHTVMRRQMEGCYPRPSWVYPELTDAFDDALMAALATDPQDRPDTVEFRYSLLEAHDEYRRRQSTPQISVVIIDDDPMSLAYVEGIVRNLSSAAKVIAMTDSESALAYIHDHPPDLVLSDLNMPALDGAELVQRMRESSRTQNVPVIMVTGVGGASDWERLRPLGVEELLLKPISSATLCDTIQRVFQSRLTSHTLDNLRATG